MDCINSDIDPTMAAVKTFYDIVQQIQASNLNYQLYLTPYAANISLKKTPTKDISGRPFPSPPPQSKVCSDVHRTRTHEADTAGLLGSEKVKQETQVAEVKQEFVRAVDESSSKIYK